MAEAQYVISEANRGDCYYFILKGVVRVLQTNPQIENWAKKRAEYERLYKWKTTTFDPKHMEAKAQYLKAKDLERRRSLLRNRLKAKQKLNRQTTLSFTDGAGSRKRVGTGRKESVQSNNLSSLSQNRGVASSSLKITEALQGLNL